MARHGKALGPADFAGKLGHEFAQTELLVQALTHPSASTPARPDNQRLEFLGDRVLGLAIAEALIEAYPDEPEGALAPRFNQLVRRETLAEVAAELDLGTFLALGRSESLSGGRRKKAVLADAMEAVIAAVYLDAGFDVARQLVLRLWAGRIEAPDTAPMDAKTRLQELVQSRGEPPPDYRLASREGPDHAPVFTVTARIRSGQSAVGTARSKKAAEQAAAAELLALLGDGSKS